MQSVNSNKIFGKYLNLLGITLSKPCLEDLNKIVFAHMTIIPFENLSKLYYFKTLGQKGIPELSIYLDGIKRYHFGGTCYSNNYNLNQLLRFLGYDVTFCGADMNKPDVHIANLVKIEGKEFIVDAGYAAPFLMPLPRFLDIDFKIPFGKDEYVLSPMDNSGCSQMSFFMEGVKKHGYLLKPAPRAIDYFHEAINNSYHDGGTFMDSILLVRFGDGYSIRLHNYNLIESRKGEIKKKTLASFDELINTIEDIFKIPEKISRIALEGASL